MTAMPPLDPNTIILVLGFAVLGIAILTWIVVVFKEISMSEGGKEGVPPIRNKHVLLISSVVFNAAPAQSDVRKSVLPVRVVVERLIPIVLWLLIIVPMIVLPIVLVVMPLLHIPWTFLLPPTP